MLKPIYQSENLQVFNKASGLTVLADRAGGHNLWDLLKSAGSKPYLIHRLDKGTSGVLLVARNQSTQSEITRAFAARSVNKYYVAKVVGHFPTGNTFIIDLPLCKGRKSRFRVAAERASIFQTKNRYSVVATRPGVPSLTRVRCLQTTAHHSVLLLKPITGRTHQLRVHLSWIGYPIVGDHLYGAPKDPAQRGARLMLHCHRLVVPKYGSFSAAVPDFQTDD